MNRTARLLVAILLGLAFGPAQPLSAATFRVSPIRVDFDKSSSSALLTLINESDEVMRFQVTAFSWSQNRDGELQLAPTEDVVFFPTLVMLKAREERKVRIGRVAPPGDTEKTYRIFFEELPPLEKKNEPSTGSQVRILTKMGVPIFVAPETRHASGEITEFTAAGGKLGFAVHNTGNVHFIVQGVKVTGLDAAGNAVFEQQRDGWYVLAGGARDYSVETPKADCAKVKRVRIEAQTDMSTKPAEGVLRGEFTVPASACSVQ